MKGVLQSRHRSKDGMTIIELVVAMLIIAVIAPGIYHGMRLGLNLNALSGQYFAAAGLGREWLEQMRGVSYDSVTTNNFSQETVFLNHIGHDDRLALNGTRSCTIQERFYPTRKLVTINVDWIFRGEPRTEQLTSVIFLKNEAATDGIHGDMSGHVGINPNNSPDNAFEMTLPDNTTVTRDDLTNHYPGYTGGATEVRFKPKGNGSQNTLMLNGESFTIFNNTTYTISSDSMQVNIWNTNVNPAGKAVGQWYITITATNARIEVME